MRYTDEHLNYWGEIYCRANLLDYDLPFALFVRDPWKWLIKFGVNDSNMPTIGVPEKPLLPKDTHAQKRVRRDKPAEVVDLAEYRARRAPRDEEKGARDRA